MSLADLAGGLGRVVTAAGAMFEAPYRVQPRDLDELDHANNVSYVRWLEWITRQHNAAFGLGQAYLKASGTVFVVVDYQLHYLKACGLDEDIRIRTRIVEYGRYSHDRAYQIVAERDGALLFEGAGKWVCMNLSSGRLARMPQDHLDRMAAMAAAPDVA